MSEIVKYNNYMNTLSLKGFTSVDLDFLMALCAKLRDEGTKEMTFSFSEIKSITKYKVTSHERFVNELERMNKKLMEVTCKLRTEDRILMFVLFPTFDINLKDDTLTVSVNEKFRFILNEIISGFTRFELSEFVNLNSKYSKNLYRHLKQYKSSGVFYVSNIEEFKEKMDCPKSYTNKEFTRTVIQPALNELQSYFTNLKCEVKKASKRGSPVIGYEFTFDAEQVHKPEPKSKSKSESKSKPKSTQVRAMTKGAEIYNSYSQRHYTEDELYDLECRLLEITVNNLDNKE